MISMASNRRVVHANDLDRILSIARIKDSLLVKLTKLWWLFVFAFSPLAVADNFSLRFDGINDYVEIPRLVNFNAIGTGNFTIEMRVKASSTNAELYPILFSNRTSHSSGVVIFLHTGTEPFQRGKIWLNMEGYNYPCSNCPDLRDNNCHHIAVVKTETSIIFYVDGVEVTNRPVDAGGDNIFSTGNIRLGHDVAYTLGTNHFNGEIGEVRLWNVARSATEIAALQNILVIPAPSSLIGYWKCSEGTGQTIASQLSGGSAGILGDIVSGDVSEPAWLSSCTALDDPVNNDAYRRSMDGVDDFIEIPGASNFNSIGTGAFTVEARIKVSASNTQLYPALFSNRTDHNTGIILFVHTGTAPWESGKLWANIEGINYPCSDCPDFRDDKCHHVALTNNGTSLRFYVDGELVTSRSVVTPGNSIASTGALRIGHDAGYSIGTNHFKGEISELRLWNVERTALEISQNQSNAITSPPASLLGYWKLNETNGQVVYSSRDGVHGRLGTSYALDASDPSSVSMVCSPVLSNQYIQLPVIPPLTCHSKDINLTAYSSAGNRQTYVLLSGEATLQDTMLTVQGTSPITLRISAPASSGILAADTLWKLEVLEDETCQTQVYNFVSANGDGENDFFEVNCPPGYSMELKIFDRWGTLIFENSAYDNSWNGGNRVGGSYRYQLILKGKNEQVLSGNIYLVK
ncbi:MAG: gliding motility-associated C-terminal domain-containing protein [Cytophagaceae bacterium]|nr:gliding motility-associated C-terminal domain-containing protein [Cytophagaceae bacterium]